MKKSPNYLNLLSEKTKKETIDALLKEVQTKNKLILYFHGGLTPKNYMRKKLGGYLLETMFAKENLNTAGFKSHVVFMEYDTNPYDILNLLKKPFKKRILKILLAFLKTHIPVFIKQVANKAEAKKIPDKEYDVFYKKQLKVYTENELIYQLKNFQFTENHDKKKKPFFKKTTQKWFDKLLIKLFLLVKNKNALIDAFVGIGMRYFYQTNHKIEVTILEELLKTKILLNLASLIQDHWKKVYRSSKKIWETEVGNYFLEQLLKLYDARKSTENPLLIDLVSHSAGSIPISYLVKKLQSNTLDTNNIINNAVIIAPAVKIQLFQELVLRNALIKKLKVFLLDEKSEQQDSVAKIFSSSLLYLVASVAEKEPIRGEMTLLGLHRFYKNNAPYTEEIYNINQSRFGNIKACKTFLFDSNQKRATFVSKLENYDETLPAETIITKGASHSGTKLPHKSPELAKNLIQILTEDKVTPTMVNTTQWNGIAMKYKV